MTVSSSAAEYIIANIGIEATPKGFVAESIVGNVGIEIIPSASVPEYIVGNIDTSVPTPQIFGLAPTAARGGDGISVIGSGFGATQLERAGVVETFNGLSWEGMSVNSWSRIAASANADTVDRAIDPASGVFDPEHEQIEVSVPSWATPPSLQIRVRTTA